MKVEFDNKSRKKVFDKAFKEVILPFFMQNGFERHTKTSKRLFKEFNNQLFAFIFFEYKSFGYGFYDLTIAFFDPDFGTVLDDEYVAMAKIKSPHLDASSEDQFNQSINEWLLDVEAVILPFVAQHSSHQALLDSDQLYFPKSKIQKHRDFLQGKV